MSETEANNYKDNPLWMEGTPIAAGAGNLGPVLAMLAVVGLWTWSSDKYVLQWFFGGRDQGAVR